MKVLKDEEVKPSKDSPTLVWEEVQGKAVKTQLALAKVSAVNEKGVPAQ